MLTVISQRGRIRSDANTRRQNPKTPQDERIHVVPRWVKTSAQYSLWNSYGGSPRVPGRGGTGFDWLRLGLFFGLGLNPHGFGEGRNPSPLYLPRVCRSLRISILAQASSYTLALHILITMGRHIMMSETRAHVALAIDGYHIARGPGGPMPKTFNFLVFFYLRVGCADDRHRCELAVMDLRDADAGADSLWDRQMRRAGTGGIRGLLT